MRMNGISLSDSLRLLKLTSAIDKFLVAVAHRHANDNRATSCAPLDVLKIVLCFLGNLHSELFERVDIENGDLPSAYFNNLLLAQRAESFIDAFAGRS